ncbi:hypothetical protein PENTCL1PPCAC_12411 [Pristionchus entomophagus]|uniref:Uncharacterized protein n=1 Tax=Pristionchus entomophagus TaxID=358040 RepID=A0AAV5T3S2_9BILA|nr:hypothetical protein PENTCL1PPCAC_12411 [Pristionchus entomophagus]
MFIRVNCLQKNAVGVSLPPPWRILLPCVVESYDSRVIEAVQSFDFLLSSGIRLTANFPSSDSTIVFSVANTQPKVPCPSTLSGLKSVMNRDVNSSSKSPETLRLSISPSCSLPVILLSFKLGR